MHTHRGIVNIHVEEREGASDHMHTAPIVVPSGMPEPSDLKQI